MNSQTANFNSKVKIQVYNGLFEPEELVYQQDYSLAFLEEKAMNYFDFDERVEVEKSFFIAYSLELLQPNDSFVVYLANQDERAKNTFHIKDGEQWYTYPQKTGDQTGSALLMEAVLCNIDLNTNGDDLKSEDISALQAFPNPLSAGSPLYLSFKKQIVPQKVEIFDLAGQTKSVKFDQPAPKLLRLGFSGSRTGTYIIRIQGENETYQTKVLYFDN